MVAHDGQPWLPRSLAALRRQTRQPDVVVAVDTGSEDTSPGLLRDALGPDAVLSAPRGTGFGDAVRMGLAHAAPGADPVHAWVWVLHDDSAPDPRALELLLDAGAGSSSVGVVGPKLVAWDDDDLLVEVGLTVGRGGRRDTGLDGVERDQGQHDHRSDVLAVPSAGLLVRRAVWDELGGFDPALPLLRDDIDLCWRTHLAGHRVVLAPRAVVADAQASTRGLRSVDAVPVAVRRVDRQHGQHVALARCGWLALPFLLAWITLVSLTRATLLLAAKSPGRAAEELRAVAVTLLLPWRWLGSRWRSRGRRTVRRASLAPLMTPRFAPVRHAVDVLGGWAARDRGADLEPDAGDAGAIESGPVAEEAQTVVLTPTGWGRRVVTHPLTVVSSLLLAATLVAWRRLLAPMAGGGALVGGELRASGSDATSLWHAALDAVRGPGLGTDQLASPGAVVHAGWVWLVARFAGSAAPSVSTELLLVAAPVLAGVAAYVAAGAATRSRWLRGWAALVWGGAPLLTTALGQGRVGPVAVTVLLPLVAALVARTLTRRASGTLTATFAAAIGLALVATALPAVALVGAAVALASVLLCRGGARVRSLLLVVLPPALLGPWLAELVADPRLLLAGPAAVAHPEPGAAIGDGLSVPFAWTHAVDLPGGAPAWAAALWVGPLVLLALVALTRGGPRGRVVAVLGWVGLLGLALAALAPSLLLSRPGQLPLTSWAGAGGTVVLLALVAAPVVAGDGLRRRLARFGFGWRQLVLAPLVALGVLAPLLGVGAWAWQGADGTLRHTTGTGLPAVARDAATGVHGTRTLVLADDAGRLTYRLDGGEPASVARDLAQPVVAAADVPLRAAVTQVANPGVTPVGEDVVAGLHRLAVGFVLVREPVPAALAERLDATAGLARIGRSADGQLWRVGDGGPDDASRARVQRSSGTLLAAVPVSGPHAAVDTDVADGPRGRLLVLSEQASTLRTATLDGTALRPVRLAGADAWRQAYALPAQGGHLVVSTVDPLVRTWRWVQLALLVLVGLLALPVRRPNGELR
ncbi:hypothetical protein GCM10027446_30170 [Angustibacter peucedani]